PLPRLDRAQAIEHAGVGRRQLASLPLREMAAQLLLALDELAQGWLDLFVERLNRLAQYPRQLGCLHLDRFSRVQQMSDGLANGVQLPDLWRARGDDRGVWPQSAEDENSRGVTRRPPRQQPGCVVRP